MDLMVLNESEYKIQKSFTVRAWAYKCLIDSIWGGELDGGTILLW